MGPVQTITAAPNGASSDCHTIGPFGPDTDLRRWGERYAGTGARNAKKRAVVAVARRLSVLLLALWKTGEVYEPLRHATAAATEAA